MEQLLQSSHFVSLNMPLNSRTRGMIGTRELEFMRHDAILIHAARGGVLDQAALVWALENGKIAGAAIDVTEPLPRNHPLLSMDNLVMAPHLGSATVRTRRRMGDMAAANLEAGLSQKALPHRAT